MTLLHTLRFSPWFTIPVGVLMGSVVGIFLAVCVHRYVSAETESGVCLSEEHECGGDASWSVIASARSRDMVADFCMVFKTISTRSYFPITLTAMLWSGLLAWKFGLNLHWVLFMGLGGLLIFGSFVDSQTYILPDRVTLGGLALTVFVKGLLGWLAGNWWGGVEPALMGAFFGAGGFWLLQQIYRIAKDEEGLGSGDVKLMLFIGALVGLWGIPFVVASAAIPALAVSVIRLRRVESQGVQTRIPFGPFLCFGTLLQLFVGDEVLRWYLALYR